MRSSLLALLLLSIHPAQAASCESLAALDTTITQAASVPAKADLPAYCRVAATLRPSDDSDIKIEVWMPASTWNGKFQAVGNGGWAGSISYPAMSQAIRRGYATASTDTGHTGTGGKFALGHPEKLIDFGYRAVHEMTVKAKQIVTAFYGSGPKFSYWNGCSTGGRQGLMEAQRFPGDYDGIIAGAPANFRTHLVISGLWRAHAVLKDPASYLPKDKYALIHKAALEACDRNDHIQDGLIDDPTRCFFDPKVLLCKEGEAADCLTAAQVEAVRKVYASARNPRTGKQIFPPLEPGSELGWAASIGGPEPYATAVDHFKYVAFQDPNWDWRTFNFDSHVDLTDKMDPGINATDPNLARFLARGGKLLMYHGWSDPLIAPQNSVNYFKSVVETMGPAKTRDFVRLFMAPGVGHCRGGEGPDQFDMVSAIEQWVEHGQAPDRIVASRITNGVTERTRPLCSYPQVARFQGSGSPDDAANFVCQ